MLTKKQALKRAEKLNDQCSFAETAEQVIELVADALLAVQGQTARECAEIMGRARANGCDEAAPPNDTIPNGGLE